MREKNEHRQEEGEKVAEITKKSVKTKDKQDEDELQRRNLQENNQSEKNA